MPNMYLQQTLHQQVYTADGIPTCFDHINIDQHAFIINVILTRVYNK